jgi:hypothetical protein
MTLSWRTLLGSILLILPFAAGADDGVPEAVHGEAWFTGSLNSNGASAVPANHFLVEPYLGEAIVRPQGGTKSHTLDSANLLLYGLADDVTLGLIPRFSWRDQAGIGDLTARLQYRLTGYDAANGMPALALVLNETLPTGKFDGLNPGRSDGTGNGTYLTQFGFLSDEYVTLGGRPLRLRLDLSYGASSSVELNNRSVYGTPDGFVGHARPGPVYDATLAFEYSLSPRWATALDASYDRGDKTRIDGAGFHALSEIGQSADLVPALEYNFTADTGLIVGVQLPVWQQNRPRLIMPMAALNCVF